MTPTLLIVDDDSAIRDLFSSYFESHGYSILTANNGLEGLEYIRAHHPNLVISDLRMPKMDGLDMIADIADMEASPPIIVVSGGGMMSDVMAALRLGASDYLMKPVTDLNVLKLAVERALKHHFLVEENKHYRKQLEDQNKALKSHVDRLKLDMQAGRAVQQRLLPKVPLQQGAFKIEHDMEPSTYLSGDLVDYFTISENQCIFYMADVSGHGASSALITLLIKTQIDRYRDELDAGLSQRILEPANVLSSLNYELLKTDTNKHATFFYAVINTKLEMMHYASAAHFPSAFVGNSNKGEMIPTENLAVGLFDDVDYITRQYNLEGVNQVTLWSDGVFELMNTSTLADKEQVLLELANREDHTALEYLEQLRGQNQTTHIPDDVTVLSLIRQHE